MSEDIYRKVAEEIVEICALEEYDERAICDILRKHFEPLLADAESDQYAAKEQLCQARKELADLRSPNSDGICKCCGQMVKV